MNPRVRPIVAVFGGSSDNSEETLNRAGELGRSISAHGAIILTGGTGPADKPVKNRAIKGAMKLDSGCWVGVDRGPKAEGVPQERGFAIRSTLNHQRNYLEACMADAAICLEGGEGTMSELACCLLLGRPVALVGRYWKSQCDLDNDRPMALSALLRATTNRFNMAGSHTLEPHLIDRAAITAGLGNLGKYAYSQADESEEIILRWVLSKLPPAGPFPGNFPDVAGHETVRSDYLDWLAGMAAI